MPTLVFQKYGWQTYSGVSPEKNEHCSAPLDVKWLQTLPFEFGLVFKLSNESHMLQHSSEHSRAYLL